MRGLSALAAAVAVALVTAGCGGGGDAAPPACAAMAQPGVSLALRPTATPTVAQALCIARRYAVVIGTTAWGSLPLRMEAVGGARLAYIWQQRSLMYACDGCPGAVFRASWLRLHHPGWILHTASGAEVHPAGHPDQVLVNVGNARFDIAWADRIHKQLAAAGWTGVDVVDLGNDPRLSGTPINPVSGLPLTELQRRIAVARALELIRGSFATHATPLELVGVMPPVSALATRVMYGTYAIDAGTGFARLSGIGWERAYRYYDAAWLKLVNSYVFDTGAPLNRRQRVFGLASFLLIATPDSAYGAPGNPSDPLYRRTLGAPCACDPPSVSGTVWSRVYPNGVVAVNPGYVPSPVTLPGVGRISLPPVSAVIVDGRTVIRS
ncbi:MAG TPA: hypothetical protein VMU66_10720 [Gaiellales bacterium]|nr:hypothetical protein [Gaiellales bacterium]